jgi:hypothetical protein
MSQFRSSGQLDDPIGEDGDRGFTGINQRLQLNQLRPSEVRASVNGRMEGFWKPRKSVEAKSTALTTGGGAMNLPFLIMPSPYYKAISAVSLNTGVDPDLVTITITGHGLPVGTSGNATLSGITFTGTNYNGTVLMTVATVDTLTFPVASVTNVSLGATPRITQLVINDSAASEVLASCLFSDPNDSNNEYVIVALETIAKKINLADYSITDIKYPSGETVTAPCDMIQSFDKVFIFRGGRQAMEHIPAGRAIRAASQSGTTVTVTIFDHGLKSGDLVTISGLSGTNPPNGVQAVVSVSSIDVFTFTVATSQTASFVCTSAIAKCAFNMVPCGAYEQPLQFATSVGGFIINGNEVSVALNDTISVGSIITVRSASESSQTSGLTLGSRYTVSSVFLPSYSKTISGTPSHTAGTGIYTGLFKVTITTTVAHDLIIGQPITVSGNQANKVNGSRFVTGIVDSYTFEIHVDQSPNPSSGGSIVAADGFQFFINTNDVDSYVTTAESLLATPIFSKITSSGIGFSHMPAPPWAVSFQRRLWMPYYYNAGGTTASPTYTSRQITDEVIASDILDANTYDQIYNQFRITGGTSDYVVGLQPFFDDTLVVLNRNSIHAIKGAGGALTDTSVVELTKEIGCLARKSMIMRGNTMLFLSDSGIYGLEFLNDYNLRGTEQPLSKLVQPYIDRINRRLAQDSVAVFFDNRYYIALPLDSTVGADDARGNNSILIYNFLNQGWESLDTYGNSGFKIKNFIIASAETRERLYAVSANGGLHEIDSAESSVDRLSVSNTSDEVDTPSIDASLTTRGYDLDTLDRKRFCDAQIQVQTLAGANGEYDISFASEDPDNAVPIGTTTQFLDGQLLSPSTSGEAETASIRCRLGGVRGYTGTLILRRTIGSPKIHSVKLTGMITNRQIISQK